MLILFISPMIASTININSTQPDTKNIIEYKIEILNEQNKSSTAEVNIYYKYEDEIINSEKTFIYGKATKELEITKIGTYKIIVIDKKTKGAFFSEIKIEKIDTQIEEEKEKQEETPILDKNILLILLGIILIIMIFFVYSAYKHPKQKKWY